MEKLSFDGVKVGIKKVGCNGYAYTFEPFNDMFTLIHTDFFVNERKRVRFEDEAVVRKLNGSTFDYVREGFNFKVVITNPNEKARCGCGESVTFAPESTEV